MKGIESTIEVEQPLRYKVGEREQRGFRYLTLINEDNQDEIGAIEYIPYKDGIVIKMMNVADAYRGKYFGEKLIQEAVNRFGVVYTGTEADSITAPASHLFSRLKESDEYDITDHVQGRRGSAYVNPSEWTPEEKRRANKFKGLPVHLRIGKKQNQG